MADDLKGAKEKVMTSVKLLSKVQSVRPNALLTRTFFDSKSDEIVAMFTGGPTVNTAEFVETLNKVSPLNGAKWSKIR